MFCSRKRVYQYINLVFTLILKIMKKVTLTQRIDSILVNRTFYRWHFWIMAISATLGLLASANNGMYSIIFAMLIPSELAQEPRVFMLSKKSEDVSEKVIDRGKMITSILAIFSLIMTLAFIVFAVEMRMGDYAKMGNFGKAYLYYGFFAVTIHYISNLRVLERMRKISALSNLCYS